VAFKQQETLKSSATLLAYVILGLKIIYRVRCLRFIKNDIFNLFTEYKIFLHPRALILKIPFCRSKSFLLLAR
jgi:hypothetical protein